MNCGENVLKFDLTWFIVKPSSKSSGFDKLQIKTHSKGEYKKGGKENEKSW